MAEATNADINALIEPYRALLTEGRKTGEFEMDLSRDLADSYAAVLGMQAGAFKETVPAVALVGRAIGNLVDLFNLDYGKISIAHLKESIEIKSAARVGERLTVEVYPKTTRVMGQSVITNMVKTFKADDGSERLVAVSQLALYPLVAGQIAERKPVAEVTTEGELEALNFRIDGAVVERYAQVSGDFNPMHLDPEVARRTMFGERVAHGMLVAGLVHRFLDMNGLAGELQPQVTEIEFKFRAPIQLDSTVTISGVVGADRDGATPVNFKCRDESDTVLVMGSCMVRA